MSVKSVARLRCAMIRSIDKIIRGLVLAVLLMSTVSTYIKVDKVAKQTVGTSLAGTACCGNPYASEALNSARGARNSCCTLGFMQ